MMIESMCFPGRPCSDQELLVLVRRFASCLELTLSCWPLCRKVSAIEKSTGKLSTLTISNEKRFLSKEDVEQLIQAGQLCQTCNFLSKFTVANPCLTSSNKCHASSNKCHASSNMKLVVTSANTHHRK